MIKWIHTESDEFALRSRMIPRLVCEGGFVFSTFLHIYCSFMLGL